MHAVVLHPIALLCIEPVQEEYARKILFSARVLLGRLKVEIDRLMHDAFIAMVPVKFVKRFPSRNRLIIRSGLIRLLRVVFRGEIVWKP